MIGRRSANVCIACRSRKVKCDGDPEGCRNCDRLDYRCSLRTSNDDIASDEQDVTTVFPRKRIRLACQQCKAQKARCSGHTPICERCQSRSLGCTYDTPTRRSKARLHPPSNVGAQRSYSLSASAHGNDHGSTQQLSSHSKATDMNVGMDAVKACIDAFFDILYPSPEYSFIHKAVFLQKWHSNTVEPTLLKALCGCSARFVKGYDDDLREITALWIDEAQDSLLTSIEKPSIVKLQALQLLVLYHQSMRNYQKVVMLFSICVRMAFLLRLNYEQPSLPFLAQESRRRLMWSIYMQDTFLAGGLPDFTLCPADRLHIQLPCAEDDYKLDRNVITESLRRDTGSPENQHLGLLAHFIRVVDIRDRILRYTKSITDPETNPQSTQEQFQAFADELERILASLPADMAFSPKSLALRAYSRSSLSRYVLFHVWWHQCHCDLFRFLIPGFRESVSGKILQRLPPYLLLYCKEHCVAHAHSIAVIFDTLNGMGSDVYVIEGGLAVPAYQCANIISRTVHTPELSGTVDINACVESCLTFAKGLARYSQVAGAIVDDIQRLLDIGAPAISQSRPRTPDLDDCSPSSVVTTTSAPAHRFSRHNPVAGAGVDDDGSALGLEGTMTSPTANSDPVRKSSRLITHQQNVNLADHPTPAVSISNPHVVLTEPNVASHANEPLAQEASMRQVQFQPEDSHFDAFNGFQDWNWDKALPDGAENDLSFMFDPLWTLQNQWEPGFSIS